MSDDANIYLKDAIIKKNDAEEKGKEILGDIIEYKSDTMNIDLMAVLLIDIPYKVYIKNLELLNITEDLLIIQRRMKIIEDNEEQDITKEDTLKNQAQRDAEKRRRLLNNEVYVLLERATITNTRTKNTLNAQIEYLNGLLGGIKIRYRHITAVLIGDKNLQEAIKNE